MVMTESLTLFQLCINAIYFTIIGISFLFLTSIIISFTYAAIKYNFLKLNKNRYLKKMSSQLEDLNIKSINFELNSRFIIIRQLNKLEIPLFCYEEYQNPHARLSIWARNQPSEEELNTLLFALDLKPHEFNLILKRFCDQLSSNPLCINFNANFNYTDKNLTMICKDSPKESFRLIFSKTFDLIIWSIAGLISQRFK